MVDLREECETAFVPSSVLGLSVKKKKKNKECFFLDF